MRAIGKKPKNQDPVVGVEIARWTSKSGQNWISLVEEFSPVVGAHWSYTAPGAGGGFAQSEGYDRERSFAEMCRMAHNSANMGSGTLRLAVNRFNLIQPVFSSDICRSVFASDRGEIYMLNSLVVRAQSLNCPVGAFSKAVRDRAAEIGSPSQKVDEAVSAGIKSRISFLLDSGVPAKDITALIDAYARPRAHTPSDVEALALMETLREEAADAAFERYGFGGAVVAAKNGWETSTVGGQTLEFACVVFIEPEDSALESEKVSFTVRFDTGSVVPSDVSALWMDNGAEIGFFPADEAMAR